MLDENDYPTGRKLTKAERIAAEQRVERDAFHGEWNYAIAPHDPTRQESQKPDEAKAPPIPVEAVFLLTQPALTGISRERFDRLVEELELCRRLLAEADRPPA